MKPIIIALVLFCIIFSGCNSGYIKEKNFESLHGGVLNIKPQNVDYAEVTVTEGEILDVIQVESMQNPDKTVTFELSESEHGTMLSVQNPFGHPIKYHINMVDYSGNFHQTSSCPVMAGGGAFESWPHPIPQLVVSNFHFLGDDQGFTCTY